MKKNYLLLGMSLVLGLALVACNNNGGKEGQKAEVATPEVASPAPGLSGKVTETMDASGYTYVQVDTGTEKIWVAGPKTAVKVGDEVYVAEGAPISNFESKSLGRTFDTILFATAIVVGGGDQAFATGEEVASTGMASAAAASDMAELDFSNIKKAEGGKTVGEIFAEKGDLNGGNVKVRGKVTKFMSGIMGKNWLHIKDGTGAAGTDDLVVTTLASANVGDTVLVSGAVAADKDFGSGYKYDVIVEDAEVVIE